MPVDQSAVGCQAALDTQRLADAITYAPPAKYETTDTLFSRVPRSVGSILVVHGKSRRCAMVPVYTMVFIPQILVLGMGGFQAAVSR